MMGVIAWVLAAALAWLGLWLAYQGIRGLRVRPDELRERARADLADWAEQLEADPGLADLLRRPAVLSRYLGHALGRPALSRRELRRRAWKTLRYLDGWWGAFALNRLAWDCIAWSLVGPGDAGGPGRGCGRAGPGALKPPAPPSPGVAARQRMASSASGAGSFFLPTTIRSPGKIW